MYTWPFGKHQGTPVDKVPAAYLEWAMVNLDKPEPKAEAAKELARRRGGDNPSRPAVGATPSSQQSLSAIAARARDVVAVGAERLAPCAHTAEAKAWLDQLLEGSIAPDSDVPF